jgi:hypothetical protein
LKRKKRTKSQLSIFFFSRKCLIEIVTVDLWHEDRNHREVEMNFSETTMSVEDEEPQSLRQSSGAAGCTGGTDATTFTLGGATTAATLGPDRSTSILVISLAACR